MPPRVDLLLALLLTAAGLAALTSSETASPVAVALTVAYGATLAWRRRAPLVVAAVVLGAIVLLGVVDPDGHQPTLPLALGLSAYSLGRHLPWARSLPAAVAGFALFGAAIVADGGPGEVIFAAMLYGAPYAAGLALRARAEHAAEAAARAEEVVAEERRRIARELHDVVAHSISVVALQTQAVRRRLRPDQQREIADLRAVEAAAREAMAEMRRLFGVLRAAGDGVELAPQPGLEQLADLLERSRGAGVPVELSVEGAPAELAPGLDLAAYRVVQEGLTNVRRHAGRASAWVHLSYRPDALEVTVEDDGRGPGNVLRSGHGLVGMRERAALYGGRLETGPGPRGGFRVRARFPLSEPAT